MMGFLRVVSLSVLLSVGAFSVSAQEMEYKMEIGAMAGGCFYMGDANYSVPFKNLNFAGGAMARYNLNPRMSLKFDLLYGGISGATADLGNKFPDGKQWEFSNSVVDLGCQYEINFWGYGTGTGYKGNRRFTPYITVGLGFTYASASESVFTMNVPIGAGVKYKMAERVNIGIEWTMRFSFSDKLDGISDPYGIKGTFLKNKDSYSFTMFYISYDIMPRLRKCNNDG